MSEFYITDDRIRLHAKLDLPEEKEKCPLVILLHGLTGHMEERFIIAVQQALNAAGFAVLRTELYGHGQSEGEFRNHTLFKWISNIMTVTEYAGNLPFTDELYLCGQSQGGIAAMFAAGMRPDDYHAVVLMAPAVLIPEGAREGRLLGMEFDPDHIPDMLDLGRRQLGGNYFRQAQFLHTEDAVRRYTKPVLIVHGDEDEAVPLKYSIDTAKQYQNCRLVILPGENHDFERQPDRAGIVISTFLSELEKE